MSIKITVELQSFIVPDKVYQKPRVPPIDSLGSNVYPIDTIPGNELAELCEQFRADVFAKASKYDYAKDRATNADLRRTKYLITTYVPDLKEVVFIALLTYKPSDETIYTLRKNWEHDILVTEMPEDYIIDEIVR